MINHRTNIRALITDETVSCATFESGSLGTKRELTIADITDYNTHASL